MERRNDCNHGVPVSMGCPACDEEAMPDSFFRQLNDTEIEEFRQWARDNHKAGDKIEGIWHPAVREECRRIDRRTP